MKHIFIVCLLMLVGESLMAQGQLKIGYSRTPEVPGYAGAVVTSQWHMVNGKYRRKSALLPYARVCLIDGKDTIRLTCDAIGTYFWKTDRIPDTLEFQLTVAGLPTYTNKFPAKLKGCNWVNLVASVDSTSVFNDVIISTDKVEGAIQGDTITFPVENAFKTFEGDFVGDFLRSLPGFTMENGFLTLNGQPIHRIHLNIEEGREARLKSVRIANILRMVEQEKEARKKEKLSKRK